MGTKQYRAWSSANQDYLLPPSPREWLPEKHLVYFVLDIVEVLDLSAVEDELQSKDPRGERPYHPAMMVALLVYAYCTGIFSSRKIAQATYEQVAFRVLAGGQHPHFTRINAFRKRHLGVFAELFKQVLLLCQQAGLVKLGHVALDGTKVQANASKHKAMSYAYMQELERRLECEIAKLLEQAEEADAEDDDRLGEGHDDEDLPEELRRREDRLEKLRAAKAALQAESRRARAAHLRELAEGCEERAATSDDARQRKLNATLAATHREAADALSPADESESPFETTDGLPMHQVRAQADGEPHPKAQWNFTDPESRLMETGGSFVQGYNCQAGVDDAHQIVLAASVTNQPPDAHNCVPMVDAVIQNVGQPPQVVTADSGFWAPTVEAECAARGVNVHIAIERRRHWDANPEITQGPVPDGMVPRDRMRHKLRSVEGRAAYARRKSTIEPVFGQIKEVRGFGDSP